MDLMGYMGQEEEEVWMTSQRTVGPFTGTGALEEKQGGGGA